MKDKCAELKSIGTRDVTLLSVGGGSVLDFSKLFKAMYFD